MFSPDSVILIVDDSSGVRVLIKNQLETLGFSRLLEASDGKEAVDLLDSHYASGSTIHLIIADWRMPELDGIQLLKVMKRNGKYKDIPFLMIAAENDMNKIAQAVSEGVTDFLVKPFEKDQLSETLTAIWTRLHSEK